MSYAPPPRPDLLDILMLLVGAGTVILITLLLTQGGPSV